MNGDQVNTALPTRSQNNFGQAEHSYIVHGATVVCTCSGGATTTLQIPDRGAHTGYGPKAMDADGGAGNFTAPFAKCTRDPDLRCDLSALSGAWDLFGKRAGFTQRFYSSEEASQPAMYPLDYKAILTCWKGGIISLVDNGQIEDNKTAWENTLDQQIGDTPNFMSCNELNAIFLNPNISAAERTSAKEQLKCAQSRNHQNQEKRCPLGVGGHSKQTGNNPNPQPKNSIQVIAEAQSVKTATPQRDAAVGDKVIYQQKKWIVSAVVSGPTGKGSLILEKIDAQ